MSVFSIWSLEENYFGREILVKEYDKTEENTSVFKEFLKDHYGILQGGFATLNRLEIFLIKHKPSDFLQRLTVSLQNFSLSLSDFLRFYSLLLLATKRSCLATYKRALRNFFGNCRFCFFNFHRPS